MCNWKCKECGFAGMDDYDECPFCENERLRRDYAEAQHKIGEYVDLTGRLRAALERIERRGLEIISEHVDGSDASYVAQELTALAREALQEGE